MDTEHINSSIARALKGESQLDPEVLKIHGFSTPTMRNLVNLLCNIDGIRYLEVGCFCGASLIAAFNNNSITAIGIDDFSQDFSQKNVREQMMANLAKWGKQDKGSLLFFESDCFVWAENYLIHHTSEVLGAPPVPNYDVFMYDGRHDTAPTARALPAFFDLLSDRFILIMDDYSWPSVWTGCEAGFEALADRCKIVQEWEMYGQRRQDDAVWHNGLAIFLCEKIK